MLIHFAILVLAFVVMSLVPGVRLGGVGSAIIAAIVFVLLNFFLGWIVRALLIIGTLGVAFVAINFLTNLVVLWITDKLLKRFEINGFIPLLICAAILTLANALAHGVVGGHFAHHVTRYSF